MLNDVASQIKSAGGEVTALTADISKAEDAQAVVDSCMEKYGRIDILINNAGVQTQNDITFLELSLILMRGKISSYARNLEN